MSKSKNNGVDPQALIDTMGADTARLFVMFASPPEQTLEWSDSGVDGSHRFLRRVWSIANGLKARILAAPAQASDFSQASKAVKDLRLQAYSLLRQANYDYERIQYNTVVSANMKLLNAIDDAALPEGELEDAALREVTGILIRMLYPIVPHITWHLWNELGYVQQYGDLLDAPWPSVDEAALIADEIELMLQINGKLRGSIQIPNGADREHIEAVAKSHPSLEKFLEGRPPKRVIVVPGKLVNIVG